MARSSQQEPVEKFRFKVTFFTFNTFGAFNFESAGGFNVNAAGNAPTAKNSIGDPGNIVGGFSAVTLPKANANVIEYRENTDMNRTSKQVGLVSYDPVTLSRGVTRDAELYKWFQQVHNDVYDLNKSNEIAAAVNWVPVHNPNYRKEMIISSLDREGNAVKHWLCVNCFPTSYSGGNGLDASANDKLVEEMTITYEAFAELRGGDLKEAFEDLQKQSAQAATDAAGAILVGAVVGGIAGALN